jgi:hypothetical protein
VSAYNERGGEKHETGDERGAEAIIQGPQLYRNDMGCIERTVSVSVPPARGMTGLFRHYFYSIISFLLRPFTDSSLPLLKMPLKA